MMNKRLFATLMPGLFVDPDTRTLVQRFERLHLANDRRGHDARAGHDGHAGHVDMGMDMKHMRFVSISSPVELFAGSRTMMSQMMLNKRLSATLMPGLFVDTDTQTYNELSDFLWNMEDMDEHMMNMNMDMGMGECEGGTDMSGMAGMDMDCDSMDHSMTPMMLVTAQGEVKTPEAMGHAGHDMGSMPAEAMPQHDMSAMPAESMPSGPRHVEHAGRSHAAGPRHVEHAGRVDASGPRHVEHAGSRHVRHASASCHPR